MVKLKTPVLTKASQTVDSVERPVMIAKPSPFFFLEIAGATSRVSLPCKRAYNY